MARPIRIEYPGAVDHVTARGNERRRTFRDDTDRRQFMRTLAQAVEEQGPRWHGYCLMANHYHLLVETPRGNLSRGIGWLQTTYTVRFNRRHRRSGHLFQGRFKAHVVEADNYAMELLRYVHLNPVRPRDKNAPVPAERRTDLARYPWSSHRAYFGKEPAPDWLCTQWLSFFGATQREARRQYGRFIADAFGAVLAGPWEGLRFGLALGSETFVERMRGLLELKDAPQLSWVSRMEDGEKWRTAAHALAEGEHERRWRVWVRVHLGGEPRIHLAREYGYGGGSAITQILRRLETCAQTDAILRARMAGLKTEHEKRCEE